MILSCHQPQYLPYLGFFHKLAHSDVFVVLDDVQFQKGGLQNRNKVKTNQGWQWLTVPVIHHFGQTIREVQVNTDGSWQRKHIGSLATSYSRAPQYHFFKQDLESILDRRWDGLMELNMELVQWAMGILDINTQILYSSELGIEGSGTERLVSISRAVKADVYLSGSGGHNYLDIGLFENSQIKVAWQQFSAPVYRQVHSHVGFLPDLSVVDVLFSCGIKARKFLE